MTVKQNLIAARALIDTPEKWGKGPDGIDPPACGMCAMNVCVEATEDIKSEHALYRALKFCLPNGPWLKEHLPIAAFNDHPDTTHADIMALFDRAIQAQEDNHAG